MRERLTRRSRHRPGAEHRISDFDDRPAQVYVQAMTAARVRSLSGFAALVAGLTQPRRRRP